MSKEKYNQIIDIAYNNYCRRHTSLPSNPGSPLLIDNLISIRPIQYDKEGFINKIKTSDEFSKAWGLKIEERELSLEERKKIYERDYTNGVEVQNDHWLESKLKTRNIPKRLITISFSHETVQVYE